jgi:uncharacterized protein
VITGTLINSLAIILGSLFGIFIRRGLSERLAKLVFQSMGLFSLYMGLSMALKSTAEPVLIAFSLVLGVLVGEALRIEDKLTVRLDKLKTNVNGAGNKFTEGLITSSVLFAVGSMAIVGPIEEALSGQTEIIYTKSLMDGFTSILLAAGFGYGVLFSFIPVLVLQGGVGLLAKFVEPYLEPELISLISGTGGLLIIALGFSIMEIKKFSVLNMLPALIFAILLHFTTKGLF